MSQPTSKQLDRKTKKPGWDLAELDKLGADAGKPRAKVATSAADLRQHSEGLQKKATRMKARWVPLVCLLCVCGLVLWAALAKIDQVTRGHGKVIPSTKVQTIQSLEDGIVRRIPVREGDIVEKGQAVMLLDDTLASANYTCLLYTSPSPRDQRGSRMPSSA